MGCGAGARAARARRKVPCRVRRPALAPRDQWRPGAVRRRPIAAVPAGSPAKWRRRRRLGGCGAAVALAMPGSRRREPCPRLTALRGRSGGEDGLGRRRLPAEGPAAAGGGSEEGGAGRGLPAREAPRPSPSREAAVRGAAGTAGAAPALHAWLRGERLPAEDRAREKRSREPRRKAARRVHLAYGWHLLEVVQTVPCLTGRLRQPLCVAVSLLLSAPPGEAQCRDLWTVHLWGVVTQSLSGTCGSFDPDQSYTIFYCVRHRTRQDTKHSPL